MNEIESNGHETITALADTLSRKSNIPLSTLKLNAGILKDLGLIKIELSMPVELTPAGKQILRLLGEGK